MGGRPRPPVRGRLVRRGDGRLRGAEPGGARSRAGRARSSPAAGWPARDPRDHAAAPTPAVGLLLAVVRAHRARARLARRGSRRLPLPAGVGEGVSLAGAAGGADERRGPGARPLPDSRWRHHRDPLRRAIGLSEGWRGGPRCAGSGKEHEPLRRPTAGDDGPRRRGRLAPRADGGRRGSARAAGRGSRADAGGGRRRDARVRWKAASPDARPAERRERCELKTARLFECACVIGWVGSDVDGGSGRVPFGSLPRADRPAPGADAIGALQTFGGEIGLAFQLLDDVLDVTGPAERTGKARGTDLLDGTVTLPLILARERDRSLASIDLRALDAAAAEAVCDRIAATGVLEEVRDDARERVASAKRALEAASLSPDQRHLLQLVADGVVERYS